MRLHREKGGQCDVDTWRKVRTHGKPVAYIVRRDDDDDDGRTCVPADCALASGSIDLGRFYVTPQPVGSHIQRRPSSAYYAHQSYYAVAAEQHSFRNHDPDAQPLPEPTLALSSFFYASCRAENFAVRTARRK